MPRSAYHHGDLHHHAMDHAMDILLEHGDSAISLRALAKHLGVSAPALYRHFADKESLLAELAVRGFEQLRTQLLDADYPTPREALIGIGLTYISFAQRSPKLYRLMFGGRVLPKGVHPRLDAAGHGAFQVLQDTVAEAQKAGYLREQPVALLTAAAWSVVHGVSQLTIDGHLPSAEQEPALAEGITTLLLDGARATHSTQ